MLPLATATRFGRTSWFSLPACCCSPSREIAQQVPREQEACLEAGRCFPSPKLNSDLLLVAPSRTSFPGLTTIATASHRFVPVKLGVRFLKELHEFPPCCPHGSNTRVQPLMPENQYMIRFLNRKMDVSLKAIARA